MWQIIFIIIALVAILVWLQYTASGQKVEKEIEKIVKKEAYNEAYDKTDACEDNIPNIIYNEMMPHDLPWGGDLPLYKRIGGYDIRGAPKGIVDMIASSYSTKNPHSLERSANTSMFGALQSARGISNGEYVDKIINDRHKSHGTANHHMLHGHKHKFGNTEHVSTRAEQVKENIMFNHMYGFKPEI